jgi:hypothetical protein
MEFINELKSPQDIPDVVGVDWAASDRVVLVCQDGSIRVMGLALSGTGTGIKVPGTPVPVPAPLFPNV